MIKNSFVFLPGIKETTEENIWKQGIKDWNEFLEKEKIRGFSKARKKFYDKKILTASKALIDNNSSFFKNMVKTWRLYDYFKEEAVFLDIEVSRFHNDIIMIGLFDGYETKTMIKGFNLDKELLKKELLKYKLIITFNGSSFDLPRINKYFNKVLPEIPHIDLRPLCTSAGLKSGLKQVERMLGLKRSNEIIDKMYSGDPSLLWRKFLATGNEQFLRLLIEYNEEDIINLKPIADFVIKKKWLEVFNKKN